MWSTQEQIRGVTAGRRPQTDLEREDANLQEVVQAVRHEHRDGDEVLRAEGTRAGQQSAKP